MTKTKSAFSPWGTRPAPPSLCGQAGLCTHFKGNLGPPVSGHGGPPAAASKASLVRWQLGGQAQGHEDWGLGARVEAEEPLCRWTDMEKEGR